MSGSIWYPCWTTKASSPLSHIPQRIGESAPPTYVGISDLKPHTQQAADEGQDAGRNHFHAAHCKCWWLTVHSHVSSLLDWFVISIVNVDILFKSLSWYGSRSRFQCNFEPSYKKVKICRRTTLIFYFWPLVDQDPVMLSYYQCCRAWFWIFHNYSKIQSQKDPRSTSMNLSIFNPNNCF